MCARCKGIEEQLQTHPTIASIAQLAGSLLAKIKIKIMISSNVIFFHHYQ